MAATYRHRKRDLTCELQQHAPAFGFFQAVRMVNLACGKGPQGLPSDLRFRARVSLTFPVAELSSYQAPQAGAGNTHSMEVNFIGLAGPSGVLPTAYTELLLERIQRRDTAARDFFDLFNHRVITLFYRAWQKYRVWAQAEAGISEGVSRNLLDLCGMGMARLRDTLGQGAVPPEEFFLRFAGLLAPRPLPGEALVSLLEAWSGAKVGLESFVGHWMTLPEDCRTRLGSAAFSLGQNTLCGQRAWDRQTTIRLVFGPLRRAQFDHLQPGAPGHRTLCALVQFAVGHALGVEIELRLDRADLPPPALGGAALAPRLGCNVWLGTPRGEPAPRRYRLLH